MLANSSAQQIIYKVFHLYFVHAQDTVYSTVLGASPHLLSVAFASSFALSPQQPNCFLRLKLVN